MIGRFGGGEIALQAIWIWMAADSWQQKSKLYQNECQATSRAALAAELVAHFCPSRGSDQPGKLTACWHMNVGTWKGPTGQCTAPALASDLQRRIPLTFSLKEIC